MELYSLFEHQQYEILEQHRFPLAMAPVIAHPDQATITVARLSPDATKVATASVDGTVRIWDAATGEAATRPLQHKKRVRRGIFASENINVAAGTTRMSLEAYRTLRVRLSIIRDRRIT